MFRAEFSDVYPEHGGAPHRVPEALQPPAALDFKPTDAGHAEPFAEELLPVAGDAAEEVTSATPAPVDVPGERANLFSPEADYAYEGPADDEPKRPAARPADRQVPSPQEDGEPLVSPGEIPPPEPPLPPTAHGEAGDDDRTRLLRECAREMYTIRVHIDAGIESGMASQQDFDAMGTDMGDLIQDQGIEGNYAEARHFMDVLTSTPGISGSVVARGLLRGLSHGAIEVSAVASQRLRSLLRTEQGQLQHAAQEEVMRIPSATPSAEAEVLNTVVEHFERTDLPPHSWVKDFAATDIQGWRILAGHYRRMEQKGGSDAARYRAQQEAHALELIEPGGYASQVIVNETVNALLALKDPAKRALVVDAFKNSWNDPLTVRNFQTLMETGEFILSDPHLATPDTIAFFDSFIAVRSERTPVMSDAYKTIVGHTILAWQVARYNAEYSEPEGVAAYLIGRVHDMIEAAPSNEKSEAGEKLAELRDKMFDLYAYRAADRGDFAAARVFTTYITSGEQKGATIFRCLNIAKTEEDIARFRPPDSLPGEQDSFLDSQFRFAQAVLADDTATVARVATAYVRTRYNDTQRITKEAAIATAYDMLTKRDPARAHELARLLVTDSRLRGESYAAVAPYSEALIKAGDTDEPWRAFGHITRRTGSIAEEYTLLRRLTHVLSGDD